MSLESAIKRKRCAYVNEEQKTFLVEFMKNHLELQSGKFSKTFTQQHGQKLWKEVTTELNKIPGAEKDWKQWRKCWQDMRCSAKAKNSEIKQHARRTSGGPSASQVLTETDLSILSMVNPTVVEGHKTITKSTLTFDWSNFPEVECPFEVGESMKCFASHNDNLDITQPVHANNDTKLNENNRENENTASPKNKSLKIGSAGIKRSAAAQRFHKSVAQTEKLAAISLMDSNNRKCYYERKLELYTREMEAKEREVVVKEREVIAKEREVAIKEREVVAQENLAIVLQEWIKKK